MALALVYRHTDPSKLRRVRAGLRWIAHVEATPGTGLMGESWKVEAGRVLTVTAMPHLWEHTLFYVSALRIDGARRYAFSRHDYIGRACRAGAAPPAVCEAP